MCARDPPFVPASSRYAFDRRTMATMGFEMVEAPKSVGRKKRSAIWQYFSFSIILDKSICQEKADVFEICSHHISGKFSTNLKQHPHLHSRQFSSVHTTLLGGLIPQPQLLRDLFRLLKPVRDCPTRWSLVSDD